MTVLGYWIVVGSLITAGLATFRYYRLAVTNSPVTESARVWVRASALSVVAASIVLMLLLLNHDFTNGYVYGYSSRDLPLHFLISSFYAGQEGSFLFWALCSAIISVVLMRSLARQKHEAAVMSVYMGAQAFLLLLLVAKTPFHFLWEKYTEVAVNTVPPDGSGLNPLLQNFWMTIHPPVLFVGFAALAVPFAFAVAALWRRQFNLLRTAGFPWIIFGTLVLGMGLMLGAYWAYGVLGWGGYWGWDPVENSSLVPWLTSVALIHTIVAERNTKKFLRTNLFLAIVSFVLVIYSTFLTRSGVLGDSSVHSFTDPGTLVYSLLLGFMLSVAFVGFGFMIARRKDLAPEQTSSTIFSRESLLWAGAAVILISTVIVLFGTSLPIFSNSSVEPAFYDKTNLPLGILIAALMGFALFAQWNIDDVATSLKRSLISFVIAVAAGVGLFFGGVQDWQMLLFGMASAYAIAANVYIVMKTKGISFMVLGGKMAHIGTAIFFLGVIGSGKYGSTQHVTLPLNTPQEVHGHTLTYTGYEPIPNNKFAFNVKVQKDGKTFLLAPVMFDAGQQGVMKNPDIEEFLTRDFYLAPVSLEQPSHDHGQGPETFTLQKGETVSIGSVKARFIRFEMDQHGNQSMMQGGTGMSIGSVIELADGGYTETVIPATTYGEDGTPNPKPIPSKLLQGTVQLVAMNVGTGGGPSTVTIGVSKEEEDHTGHDHGVESLVVEASIKPFIGLVWVGSVLMFIGFGVSAARRSKEE